MLSFDSLKLKSVTELSHNTSKFTFEFPDANQVAGLQVASCLVVKADLPVKDPKTGEVAVKPVIRPYTPTSTVEQKGSLDLVVKVYPGLLFCFLLNCLDGVMSQHFKSLKVGDALAFKGPFPKIDYEANKWNHVGLVAGGTGIVLLDEIGLIIFRRRCIRLFRPL